MTRAISARAYAKVNLALAVGPPQRPGSAKPGWHPIASWMHAVSLWDDVAVEPLPQGPSVLDRAWAPDAPAPSPIDWPVAADLALRAHELIEREVGRALPARVRVTKRIPAGAGLGGGSSDAAAVLVATNSAFELGVPVDRLRELGMTLGSDVAFFIDDADPPRPALVEGFGDRLTRVERSGAELLVLMPNFGCPTREVYGAFDGLGPGELRGQRVRAALGRVPDPASLFNDLAPAACAVRPALAALRDVAETVIGLPVHITGSGSAMFVVSPPERLVRIAGLSAIRVRLV